MSGTTRTSALAPFRIRSYRFQWPSDLLTSWAFEVETLVLGWYIMVETGSVLLLTVLASLQYVGTLVAPVVGMIGDRMGHRDLLAVMRFAYTALAGTIMTLALTGHLAPVNVMIIVAIMGLIRPSDLGVRGALLADIMPPEQLVGAISCEHDARVKVRHVAHIVGMMVSDDLHGRGVGRQLLQRALMLLEGEPVLELVTLSVTSSNLAAVRLYESCGFIRYGRLMGAIKLPDGRLVDKDLMSRRLR